VRHLRHVERETQRCKRIVENLVRFSAGARCAFSKVDVNELVEQTIECTERQLSMRGIELDVALDRTLPSIIGDSGTAAGLREHHPERPRLHERRRHAPHPDVPWERRERGRAGRRAF